MEKHWSHPKRSGPKGLPEQGHLANVPASTGGGGQGIDPPWEGVPEARCHQMESPVRCNKGLPIKSLMVE